MSTTLTPYLHFKGNTREAFAFYEKALGAKIQAMLRYADMPAPPEGAAGADCAGGPQPDPAAIMHACLVLPGGAMLFAGDAHPAFPYDGIKGVMLAVAFDTVEEAQKAFAALAEGGKVTMPLAPAFWARSFGMLTDRFGVDWAVNGESIPVH
ncbi:MAG: VOC family protein [Pseudomonadota bacterium]